MLQEEKNFPLEIWTNFLGWQNNVNVPLSTKRKLGFVFLNTFVILFLAKALQKTFKDMIWVSEVVKKL